MSELKTELKSRIIEALNLEEVQVEDIGNDAPLFGDGLGLDSIDALEIIVMLDKHYGIKLTDPKEGRAVITSIHSLAAFVAAHRTK